MVFSSYTFLLCLLPLVLAGFAALRARAPQAALAWLLAASWVFYGWWEWRYLAVLWASIGCNWYLAGRIGGRHSGRWLALGVALNVGLLVAFKHSGWLAGLVNAALATTLPEPECVLPLGLSFITFQQLALLVDRHRGALPAPGLLEQALFVSFFPQLIAGPIVRFRQLVPQLSEAARTLVDWARVAQGLMLLAVGLAKKAGIADHLAPWVNALFGRASELGLYEAWVAALGYTFQLYFDFSGYCDMAVGLALLIGVQLPWNFDSPYRARSIVEFWRRWHMTLGAFLRDYVYIPLGGSRHGPWRQMWVLLFVMGLAGLWHGALLVANHLWRRAGLRLPAVVGWAFTFLAVVAGWVVFRADSLSDAWAILSAMVGAQGLGLQWVYRPLLPFLPEQAFARLPDLSGAELPVLLVLIGVVLHERNSIRLAEGFRPTLPTALAAGSALVAALVWMRQPSPFLYFDF